MAKGHGWLQSNLFYLCKSYVPHPLKIPQQTACASRQAQWGDKSPQRKDLGEYSTHTQSPRKEQPCRQEHQLGPAFPTLCRVGETARATGTHRPIEPKNSKSVPVPWRKRTGKNQSLYWRCWNTTKARATVEATGRKVAESPELPQASSLAPEGGTWHSKLCALATGGMGSRVAV